MITIKIETDGAAFDNGYKATEVAILLRNIANRISGEDDIWIRTVTGAEVTRWIKSTNFILNEVKQMTTMSQMIAHTQNRAFNHGYALAMRKTPDTLADMRKVNAALDDIIDDVYWR